MKKDLVFFWIQGSWKGTQASKLISEFPIFRYLEPGNVFRAITSNDNIISQHIKERMAEGKMLDDSLVFDLFNMYYHLLKSDDLILADGFPRTIPQMYYFLSKEYEFQRDFSAIYFHITREKALERILSRAQQQNRIDDLKMEVIHQRLDLFEQETLPVIEHFRTIGKLIEIDADQDVDQIYAILKKKLFL